MKERKERFGFQEGDVVEAGYDYLAVMRGSTEVAKFNGGLRGVLHHLYPPDILSGIINPILAHPAVFGPLGEGLEIVHILRDKSEYDGRPQFIVQKKRTDDE